jgi:WD40 repeat protein
VPGIPFEFDADVLPTRHVPCAAMLLEVARPDDSSIVALNAEHEEFVRLPPHPALVPTMLSLSPDGTRMLRLGQRSGNTIDGLCLYTLADGHEQWFDAEADGYDRNAVGSPDGRSIATMSVIVPPYGTEEYATTVVSVIDITSGRRRRLWAGLGGYSLESALSWSPNGELIAATHPAEDRNFATVVVNTDGDVIGQYDYTTITPCPNGAWVSNQELLCRHATDPDDDDWYPTIVDVSNGPQQTHQTDVYPLAYLAGRIVVYGDNTGPEAYRLITTDLDGTDPQPFITVRPAGTISFFDISSHFLNSARQTS